MAELVPFVRMVDSGPHRELVDALRRQFPGDIELVEHADIDPERYGEARVAIVDGPSADQLATLPNLVLVQSTWAGVEAIIPAVAEGVAIARMIDPQLAETMAEAVLAWTLYLHRDMPRYMRQQRARVWAEHPMVWASARRVGIVGLGTLGAAAARAVAAQGFPTAGWSRSAKAIEGIECFDGEEGLRGLLARSDIVVNLLPHTVDTAGLLDARAFAAMPVAGSVINFGRGPTVDDDALLAALDSGHLDHAVLDVFDAEPLPTVHRFWTHESVTVLPHIAAPTSVETAAAIAADNVVRFVSTGALPLDAVIDRSRGY